MSGGGLDDQKLSMLSKWAAGLCRDERAEVAAAGRAIELLIDEVERLNVLLWQGPLAAVPTALEAYEEQLLALTEDEPEPARSLRRRLRQRLGGSSPT